jgi:hypothetical protein
MPFMVGVLKAHQKELDRMPLEELFMLDADSGEFIRSPYDGDYRFVLPSTFQLLEQRLGEILAKKSTVLQLINF